MDKNELFTTLTFEDAIKLFREWGFGVEPGPLPGEVTLISEGEDYRTTCVHPAGMLVQIAAVALRVRFQNGAVLRASNEVPKARGKAQNSSLLIPFPIRTPSTLVH